MVVLFLSFSSGTVHLTGGFLQYRFLIGGYCVGKGGQVRVWATVPATESVKRSRCSTYQHWGRFGL